MKQGPEEIRFTARYITSKYDIEHDPDRWNHVSEEYLRQKVADALQHEKSKFIADDFMVEKRIDIYAASPELFWEIVSREAERIATRFKPWGEER